MFALDSGKEKVRRIATDQIDLREKKVLKFKDSVLVFDDNNTDPVTVMQLNGL